jgi:hypothetical protein
MPISLIPHQLQFSYEADFVPPIVDLFGPPNGANFVRKLSQVFSIRLADMTVNQQNLARGHLFFSKWFENTGSFSVSFGGDGVSVNYVKPPSRESAWEPVDKALETLSESTEVRCEKQNIKFQGHSAPLGIKPNELISKFNIYESELLTSKGVSFTFKGPQNNSQTFVVISNSLFVPDGVFLVFDTTYFQEKLLTKQDYAICTTYLRKEILARLELDW